MVLRYFVNFFLKETSVKIVFLLLGKFTKTQIAVSTKFKNNKNSRLKTTRLELKKMYKLCTTKENFETINALSTVHKKKC